MTTLRPASRARRAASRFTTPSCSQTAFAFAAMASSTISGANSALLKTSTTSGGCGNSRRLFVVHGEKDSSRDFAALAKEKLGWDVAIPGYRDEVELD